MDCRHAVEIMHERLSGSPEAGGEPFDAHVLECGRCRTHYRALLELARTATRIPPVAPSASLRSRVAAAIAPRAEPAKADRRWLALALAGVFCVALVVGVAYRPMWQGAVDESAGYVAWAASAAADAGAGFAGSVDDLRHLIGIESLGAASRWLQGSGQAVHASAAVLAGVFVLLGSNVFLVRFARRADLSRL